MERLVGIGDVAKAWGVPVTTLRGWEAEGKLISEHTTMRHGGGSRAGHALPKEGTQAPARRNPRRARVTHRDRLLRLGAELVLAGGDPQPGPGYDLRGGPGQRRAGDHQRVLGLALRQPLAQNRKLLCGVWPRRRSDADGPPDRAPPKQQAGDAFCQGGGYGALRVYLWWRRSSPYPGELFESGWRQPMGYPAFR